MGYRNYIGVISKREYNKIKSITSEEFDKIGNSRPYELAPSIYEFGKYCEFEMKGAKRFFKNKVLHEEYTSDNEFFVVDKTFLKAIIDDYNEKIKKYYNEMLSGIDRDNKDTWTHEKFEKLFNHIRNFSAEWNYLTPYKLDEGDEITSSWKYEYGIFELVRIYKTFDWKRNIMVYYGY